MTLCVYAPLLLNCKFKQKSRKWVHEKVDQQNNFAFQIYQHYYSNILMKMWNLLLLLSLVFIHTSIDGHVSVDDLRRN